jgi:GGDEF domain-containing protein
MALKVNWAYPVTDVVARDSISPVESMPHPSRPRRIGPPDGGGARDRGHAIQRATDALLTIDVDASRFDPTLASTLRFLESIGRTPFHAPLLGSWQGRASGSADRARGFPWTLGFDSLPMSDATEPAGGQGAMWRPRERDWLDREPTQYGHRLIAPIAIAENLQFLDEQAGSDNSQIAATASEILRTIQPVAEGDVADFIRGGDPWRDTFALWQIVRRPRALELLRPLAVAIATRSGTLASRLAGLPCGTRFPFEAVPLVSASAHLGLGLWTLGYRPSLLPGLLTFVASREQRDGGWSDDGQPADVLTTLAVAELLGSLDPTFSPERTIDFFVRHQEPEGWWRALDPEVPWLTAEIATWLKRAERPFHERFAWPVQALTDLDRKTRIPGFGAFDTIDRVFSSLPGLGAAPIAMAFADLAGFREFNNRCGQDLGDLALRLFAQHLSTVSGTFTIRDGGDEFIVVGAPGRPGLADDIDAWRAGWPAEFRKRFGPDVPMVSPRFVVSEGRARSIAALRERLGREIGHTKHEPLEADGRGVLRIT